MTKEKYTNGYPDEAADVVQKRTTKKDIPPISAATSFFSALHLLITFAPVKNLKEEYGLLKLLLM